MYDLGNDRQALHKQLCEGIQQTEISEVLKSVKDGCCEEFYKYYLHDYVRNIHQSQHKEQDEQEEEYNVSSHSTYHYTIMIIRNIWCM